MTDPDAKSLHLRPTPGLRPMRPRDPHEQGRVASSLELLFDLIFVVAFATSGAQFAQLVAVGGVASIEGIVGFTVCTFGIVWAWINFAWFASAFDTDDWFYRLDMKVIVAGYVVMRLVLAVQWLRAGARNPEFRRTGIGYATVFGTAQVAWIVMALANLPLLVALVVTGIIALYELLGIFFVERYCRSTSWHPHHIAERYGLLVISRLARGSWALWRRSRRL